MPKRERGNICQMAEKGGRLGRPALERSLGQMLEPDAEWPSYMTLAKSEKLALS
jgi:hypothetical protein